MLSEQEFCGSTNPFYIWGLATNGAGRILTESNLFDDLLSQCLEFIGIGTASLDLSIGLFWKVSVVFQHLPAFRTIFELGDLATRLGCLLSGVLANITKLVLRRCLVPHPFGSGLRFQTNCPLKSNDNLCLNRTPLGFCRGISNSFLKLLRKFSQRQIQEENIVTFLPTAGILTLPKDV